MKGNIKEMKSKGTDTRRYRKKQDMKNKGKEKQMKRKTNGRKSKFNEGTVVRNERKCIEVMIANIIKIRWK